MPDQASVAYLDLGGGRNGNIPASHIGDNQQQELRNFYPLGPRLRRRPGVARLTSAPYAEALTSLFGFKADTGDWTLIAGALTGLARLDGTGLVPIARSDGGGLPYVASSSPWVFSQYQGVAYVTRPSTGTLKRAKPDFIMDAGISAPSVRPTLADGGAGDLIAADYYGIVTFYNSETGAESNPSPVSLVLTLGASKRIAWSAIPVSLNGQVNARRLYRTLPGQQGQYFFVGQINDNFTTTYDDNVLTADLGDAASFKNGLPPANLAFNAIFKERLFVTDTVDVLYSELSKPESYSALSVIPVYRDDGHRITVLHTFGDRLVVGKTNGIHFLVGTDPTVDFQLLTLTNRHGCFSHYSMKNAEGLLFWFGGDDFYGSDGTSTEPLSDPFVKDLVDRIPKSRLDEVVGAVYPSLGWYVASISVDEDESNTHLLVYNYKTKAWAVFQYFENTISPTFIGDFFDTTSSPLLYAVYTNGHIYNMLSGLTDDGTPISAEIIFKAWGWSADALYKGIRHLQVLCSTVAASLTAQLRRNLTSTTHKSRVISLNVPNPWKRLNLSNTDQLASLVQLRLLYSGVPEIDISGLAFEWITQQRRGQGQ